MALLRMTATKRLVGVFGVVLISIALGATAIGQEPLSPSPSPTPVPARKPIRISFLPPPLEGAISLGIYDAKGKLVRVLHREADIDDFEIGSDALSTTWDGKDDAGQSLTAGKYHARGFVVGELLVEGVDFFFNDWVTDDQSPHITKITAVAAENGVPLLAVQLPGGERGTVLCDGLGNVVTTGEPREISADCELPKPPPNVDAIACATGKDGTLWVIDRLETGSAETEVQQFSAAKELLRRLSIPAAEPQPRAIAASKDADTIFLVEENSAMQRLRGLTLLASKSENGQSISDWKVDFEKKIFAHKNFTIDNGKPVLTGGNTPPETIGIKLQANPLQKDQKVNVELAVGSDSDGSFLKTADGLPLESISDTPHLQRVVLSSSGANAVDVFQDDDAVVEQFRVSGLDHMMAFDCGDFELK
jgi:hypothetical protein